MAGLLSIVFLISFIAVWPLAIAYYWALHQFGRAVQSSNPTLVASFRAKEKMPHSSFSRSYAILKAIETRQPLPEPLPATVIAQYKRTRTLLYCSATAFLLLLFSGLGQEFVA